MVLQFKMLLKSNKDFLHGNVAEWKYAGVVKDV